jgi:hypothetical protein
MDDGELSEIGMISFPKLIHRQKGIQYNGVEGFFSFGRKYPRSAQYRLLRGNFPTELR